MGLGTRPYLSLCTLALWNVSILFVQELQVYHEGGKHETQPGEFHVTVEFHVTIDLNIHVYWCNSPLQYDADMDYKSFEDDFM